MERLMKPSREERLLARRAELVTEMTRQMEFAGLRLGVFARLRELERDARRIDRELAKLQPKERTDGD